MVTGFTKFEFEDYSQKDIENTFQQYKNYKKWFKFPAGIKGKLIFKLDQTILNYFQIMNGKTS